MLYKSNAIDAAAMKIETMFDTQWRVYTIWQFNANCFGGVMKDTEELSYAPFTFCDSLIVDLDKQDDNLLFALQYAIDRCAWIDFINKN